MSEVSYGTVLNLEKEIKTLRILMKTNEQASKKFRRDVLRKIEKLNNIVIGLQQLVGSIHKNVSHE